jgi:hypothetical protein
MRQERAHRYQLEGFSGPSRSIAVASDEVGTLQLLCLAGRNLVERPKLIVIAVRDLCR